jgi:hypothetical protein
MLSKGMQRHLPTRGQHASSEINNSLSSTDPKGVGEIRPDTLANFRKDPEFFDIADTAVKFPWLYKNSIDS